MDILVCLWDGAGCTPPVLSVARALRDRGHAVRVLADPSLAADVSAAGLEHRPWTRAPHRTTSTPDSHFVCDYEAGPEGFGRIRDRLSVGPAAAFAADVLEELGRHPADIVLSEVLLFGPVVAAEAARIPCVSLNSTINVVPAPGVPPFGFGLDPAVTEADVERDRRFAQLGMQAWDEALPALNAAREQHGLPPLDHVLDQLRSLTMTLVLSSAAFDLCAEGLPPVVRHVGPRLDDVAWAEPWTVPPGEQPLVLVALSSDFQDQLDVLRRITAAVGALPVRTVVTTGKGIDPADVPAPPHVQVVRSAPHAEVLREAAVCVTHGGHGTTIKALAAGVPLVVLPMGRDQLDIAARVVHRGAGVRLDPGAATGDITAAVKAVLEEPSYAAAARRIAAAIAHETAEDPAVEAIESLMRVEA